MAFLLLLAVIKIPSQRASMEALPPHCESAKTIPKKASSYLAPSEAYLQYAKKKL